jgi:hypothetical protein
MAFRVRDDDDLAKIDGKSATKSSDDQDHASEESSNSQIGPKGPASDDSEQEVGNAARRKASKPAYDLFASVASYPTAIGPNAYQGITGEFVRLVEPLTEADPSFLLVCFLVYAGNVLGRNAFVWAGGDRHYTNLYTIGVGPTSTGRKGSAYGVLEVFFRSVDEPWVKASQSGLSSGEGLIWAVRDPVHGREGVKKKKHISYQDVEADPGVSDKRLLIRQSEFFSVLQVMKRQGNTLSPVIRDAWDRGNLSSLSKNSPAFATEAHISIVGNITKEELRRGMLRDEADNGFANRYLWCCSIRSKLLPEGGKLYEADFSELLNKFRHAYGAAQNSRAVMRDVGAADLWGRDHNPEQGMYARLNKERHGLFGAVTARAAAQVLRLSLIYALLDCASEISSVHLEAAYEVWRYCEDGARYIFGDAIGDPTADEIIGHLRQSPAGLTRDQIRELFGRHKPATEIERALLLLHDMGRARFEKEPTKGRPIERWFPSGR